MRKNECILYIDDAPENLNSFKSVYRYHYNVLLASSAKEGLKLLQSNSVKVLLVDQRMPKITGSQFIEQVAQTYPDILKIMVTGYADIEAVTTAINSGQLFHYVTKPYDTNYLKLIIDRALELYNSRKETAELLVKYQELAQHLEQKLNERTSEMRALFFSHFSTIHNVASGLIDYANTLNMLAENEKFSPDIINKTDLRSKCINYKLTDKEVEVLEYLLSGMELKDIAKKLHLSFSTIKTHNKHIYRKVGVKNRTQLVILFI